MVSWTSSNQLINLVTQDKTSTFPEWIHWLWYPTHNNEIAAMLHCFATRVPTFQTETGGMEKGGRGLRIVPVSVLQSCHQPVSWNTQLLVTQDKTSTFPPVRMNSLLVVLSVSNTRNNKITVQGCTNLSNWVRRHGWNGWSWVVYFVDPANVLPSPRTGIVRQTASCGTRPTLAPLFNQSEWIHCLVVPCVCVCECRHMTFRQEPVDLKTKSVCNTSVFSPVRMNSLLIVLCVQHQNSPWPSGFVN